MCDLKNKYVEELYRVINAGISAQQEYFGFSDEQAEQIINVYRELEYAEKIFDIIKDIIDPAYFNQYVEEFVSGEVSDEMYLAVVKEIQESGVVNKLIDDLEVEAKLKLSEFFNIIE